MSARVSMATGYRIAFKDGPRVVWGERVVEGFRTRKAAGLLAYLAYHPGSHSRDKLLELFWQDRPLNAARNSLSNALSHLRTLLEKECGQPEGALIVATRDTISLNATAVTTDLAEQYSPERFLPGFFDDWVLEARESRVRTHLSPVPIPAALSSFLGREALQEEAAALLSKARLLTLVGPGGVGKTALALELLRAAESRGTTCAWGELADLRDPEEILGQLALALGQTREGELTAALRSTPLLLGVDNCEHLISGAASVVVRLLRTCPNLTLLATSREPLGVPGEVVLRLPGLSEAEAVALFCERARRVVPGWQAAPEEAPALASLCRHLDGLPLALEMAAAKLKTHTLPELVQKVMTRLTFLTSPSRLTEPRQQTLRDAIAWSEELLTAPERLLFRRLAVFRGGWTREQAVQVCGGQGLECQWVPELLDQLVEKSLVQVDTTQEVTRYRFLETVREYVAEQWTEAEKLPLRHVHFEVFFALVESNSTTPKLSWARAIDRDLDNVRQALEFSLRYRPEQALAFCGRVGTYWQLRGTLVEARKYLELALTLPEAAAHTLDRSNTLNELAHTYQGVGQWAAARHTLERLEETDQALGRARNHVAQRALLALNEENFALSETLFLQALQEARAREDTEAVAHVLSNQAQLFMAMGRLPEARDAVLESGRLSDRSRDWFESNVVLLDLLEGQLDRVSAGLRKVVASYRLTGNLRDMGYAFCHGAMLAHRMGQYRRAAQYFGATTAWCEHHGFILEQPEGGFLTQELAALQQRLGMLEAMRAFDEGYGWSTEETLAQLSA